LSEEPGADTSGNITIDLKTEDAKVQSSPVSKSMGVWIYKDSDSGVVYL